MCWQSGARHDKCSVVSSARGRRPNRGDKRPSRPPVVMRADEQPPYPPEGQGSSEHVWIFRAWEPSKARPGRSTLFHALISNLFSFAAVEHPLRLDRPRPLHKLRLSLFAVQVFPTDHDQQERRRVLLPAVAMSVLPSNGLRFDAVTDRSDPCDVQCR